MKIAINGIYYHPQAGGIKEYIYNLSQNLGKIDNENEYIIYVAQDCYQYALETLSTKMRIKQTPFTSKHKIIRGLCENMYFQTEEKRENFAIFHSPFFHCPNLLKAKIVMTVHDLRLYRFPQTYSRLRYWYLKNKVQQSLYKADQIIAISTFTKNEMIDLYELDAKKITVIHEAINRTFFSKDIIKDYTPPSHIVPSIPFLLTVGHLEPRKNLDLLIQAFGNIKDKNMHLFIVGKKNHGYQKTLQLIKQTPNVQYLEFIEGELLIWLYHHAKLFIFPSIYEGFGFPPLEAASLGTVSLVSQVSSIPEICQESTFYFNPYDLNELTHIIDNLLDDERLIDQKKVKLEKHLEQFSWARNARETIAVYKKVYEKN